MIRSRPRIATAVAVLLASTVVVPASAADQVKVDVAFSGLWWTEKQVYKFGEEVAEGIERTGKQFDIPLPPKETRTVIKKWDFGGDDMMPPHPDVVDVDVTVSASVSVKEPVEITYQYEEKGRRTAPVVLARSMIDLALGASQVVHGSINLNDYLEHHHRPEAIRVTTTLGKRRSVTANLPVVLGD